MTKDELQRVWEALRSIYGSDLSSDLIAATLVVLVKDGDTGDREMNNDQTMAATPHAELLAELMNPNNPKNEREHAAAREIERLQEALAQPPLPVQPDSYAALREDIAAWKQRQPLTEYEMSDIEEKVYVQTTCKGKPLFEYAKALIRATETAHGIGVKP